MVKTYTDIWNGFQFREPVHVTGHVEPYSYDLVLWKETEPHLVAKFESGEKAMITRYCFSVAKLKWNPKDHSFEFSSCGVRYLEHRIDGLEQFILDFCESIKKELERED